MPRSIALAVLLMSGCVVTADLGDHDPQPSRARAEIEAAQGVPDASLPERGVDGEQLIGLASREPAAEEAAPEEAQAPPVELEPELPTDPAPEPRIEPAPEPEPEPLPEEPAPEPEPPPEEPLPEACSVMAEDDCIACQLDVCCELRLHCLEDEACNCHRECRGLSEPGPCHEECGVSGDVYEAWVQCLEVECAEHC